MSVFLQTTGPAAAALRDAYRNALLLDTVPFWFPRSVDTVYGGFLHCLDRDGSILDDDKSVWAQGRMTWMLLTLYNTLEPKPEWREWGEQGLRFLERHAFDHDGRMFFQLARDGTPLRKRRYAFSEAFAAIAYAAHARATGIARSAERAQQLFDLFTRWNFTPGLMPPKYTDARPSLALSPRIITIVTAQELRENLGVTPEITAWIDRCITEIEHLFLKPELNAVMETVAPDGGIIDHFEGRMLVPGHAIEGAWFILREGQYRKDAQCIDLGLKMLEWSWNRGWDPEYGGLLYYRDLYDKPVQEYWHDMKFWWPHDEAIIASLLAWILTQDEGWARRHAQVHIWAHSHFADPEFGEWYGYLHRDGSPSVRLKGNLWKSFFHHPRMQWMCWRLLNEYLQTGN